MTDVHTKRQRSKNMAAIKGKDNKSTEIVLLKLLRSKKIKGWKRQNKTLPGTPDFIFSKEKLAIFVDGCFWHGCRKCMVYPKTNRQFWNKKIMDNRQRDKRVNKQLLKKGWKVIRFWEHKIKQNPKLVVREIFSNL